MQLNNHKVGMAFGLLAGLGHLVWSLLVLFGWANGYISWVLSMHFLTNPYTVMAFSWGKSLGLIVLALVVGYVVGQIFATIWNWAHKM